MFKSLANAERVLNPFHEGQWASPIGAESCLGGGMQKITDHNTMRPAAVLAWLSLAASVLLPLGNSAIASTPISSARVWPAAEYTRLTLESASPIQYSLSMVKNPDRVVVDLERVALTTELEKLPAKIDAADPYIQTMRIGRYKPGVVRLVLDLKTAVMPQAFVLKPVGDYGHRLVLDIY